MRDYSYLTCQLEKRYLLACRQRRYAHASAYQPVNPVGIRVIWRSSIRWRIEFDPDCSFIFKHITGLVDDHLFSA